MIKFDYTGCIGSIVEIYILLFCYFEVGCASNEFVNRSMFQEAVFYFYFLLKTVK